MEGHEDLSALEFSVVSMIEEVLTVHGNELTDVHTSTKAESKISTKRNEATRWLRKSVGVVAAKDLPAEPSEHNFRMGLRSGLILCCALNKTEPGAVPKLVGIPADSVTIPDGPPLSSSPYYENITNFLLAIEERGLPTFEGSDLEQGGRLSRVVNSVLALKAYSDWKKAGAHGTFRYIGNRKPSSKRKQMVCKSLDLNACCNLWKKCEEKPIHTRARDLLSGHKPRDIPIIVEIVLSKLTESYERKLAAHKEKIKIALKTAPPVKKEPIAPPEIKASPRNIFQEMESKSKASFKKDEFPKKEENTTAETKGKEERKSFSSIMNEMRKKATTDTDKPSIDTNKIEKNVPADTMKPTSDVTSVIKKNVITDSMKPTSDTDNTVKKNVITDTVKSTSDVVNKTNEKATTKAVDSVSVTGDVNNKTVEDTTVDSVVDDSDDDEEDDIVISDDDDADLEAEIVLDVVDDVEEDPASEEEEEEEEEEATAEDDVSGDVYGELEKKKKMEKKLELKDKEIEKAKEAEKQKEMERQAEMEKKREIRKKREMERKMEMERKAAEDAKEEKYYNWVSDESERLKRSIAKQQSMVDRQHKEIQALKNIFSAAKADVELLRTNYQEEVNNLVKHLTTLAQAASGYRKVVDENRKLYNLVQDLKGSIRVYCRLRPAFGTVKKPSCVDCIDETNMAVIIPGKGGKDTRKNFTFNRVFNAAATQSLVYVDTQPLIRSVLDGYNVCIFAYGQTGSGKTFTMTGPDVFTTETMGVNYRSLNDLFDIQQQRANMIAYEVCVQMLEIYNEMVRDLLSADGASKKLEIRLGTQDGINVPDAALIPVSKTEDVIRLMNLGHKNRAVGSTAMNQRSSRSHSCLTVHVSGKDLTSGSIVRGCMHLVDLAGSERADKTEATGDRLKEATFINKSLSALGDVIASLAQKSTHVPYRNSKLTLLLQDALGGQAKTLMFIHVSPDPDTVGETISTLKFAERVSTVELGAAKSNKDDIDLRQLKEQVASLKAALSKEGGGDIPDSGNLDGGDDDDDNASECSEADSQPQKAANGGAASKKAGAAAGKSTPSNPAAPAKKAAGSSPATKGKASAADTKKKAGK
ncbi:putative minus-end-directed kinesin ATPase [Helianthus annuus]|nr:putative minus-end-directed kinesin ATPase [Helianthus annuus]